MASISNFRYKANRAIMREQLNKLGFKQLVPEEHAGYIITSYILDICFQSLYTNISLQYYCCRIIVVFSF